MKLISIRVVSYCIMFMFFTAAFNIAAASEVEYREQSITPLQPFTHTVLAEELTGSWCQYCPSAAETLNSIYSSGDYPFYFVALIEDVNDKANERCSSTDQYNVGGYPTTHFDGGYESVVGAQTDETNYRAAIESCGDRVVAAIDVEVSALDMGNAVLEISVNITNNEPVEYGGHIRVYITEIISRYYNYDGDPYHFGFLDYAFDIDILIPIGSQYTDTVLWNGYDHVDSFGNDFGDIDPQNIMVIASVFNDDANPKLQPDVFFAYYTDETVATTVGPPPNYGVEITPISQSQTVAEGETALYYLTVMNTGDVEDDFILTKSGTQSNWATLSHSTITLSPGGAQQITLQVDVPPGTANGDYDIYVTATSNADPQTSSTALTTTTVYTPPIYSVILTCADPSNTVLPGESTSYTITVQNTGNIDDTIDLTKSGAYSGWAALSQTSCYLQPSETDTVTMTVDVPIDATPSDYEIVVRGTSQGDPIVYSEIITTTTVEPFVYDIALSCLQTSQSAEPGESVVYTITVENNGNTHDTIDLTKSGTYTQWGTLSQTSLSLDSGSMQDITLTVDIPSDALADEYHIDVRGTSQGNSTVYSEVTTQTTVEPVYDVELSSGQTGDHGLPGESNDYTISVENTGNADDTIDLTLSGDYCDWGTLSHMSLFLTVGSSQDINLTVEIPPNTEVGDYPIEVVGTSQGDPVVSYTLVTTTTVDAFFNVSLSCSEPQMITRPGLMAVYNVTVENNGNADDIIEITVSGEYGQWGSINQTSIFIGPGSYQVVTLTVDVPTDAQAGDFSIAVGGISQGDPSIFDEITTITTVMPWNYHITLQSGETHLTGMQGESVIYIIGVEYGGDITDTIDLTLSGTINEWAVLNASSLQLEPETSQDVTVIVEIPMDSAEGDYHITITGTSRGDSSVFDEITLTTTVEPFIYGIALEPGYQHSDIDKGGVMEFTITVENTGNAAEEIQFTKSGAYEEWSSLSKTVLNLAAGEEQTIILTLDVPLDADANNYYFKVKGTCSEDSSISDIAEIKLTVLESDDGSGNDISISDIYHSPINPTNADDITILATVTGDNIHKVSLIYGTSELNLISLKMQEEGGNHYSIEIGTLAPGTYIYKIEVSDIYGNSVESGTSAFTVSELQQDVIDSDGDGVNDDDDPFHDDDTQWEDTDGDGFGDNPYGNNPDYYPYDQTKWKTPEKKETSDWDGSLVLYLVLFILVIFIVVVIVFKMVQFRSRTNQR